MKKRILSLLTALVCAASTGLSAFAAGTGKKLTANITSQEIALEDQFHTNNALYCNWATCSPVSDFFDENGKYTIAYVDGNKGTIIVKHPAGTPDEVKIERAMPLVGGVTCDSKGNLYVAYGCYDEAGTGKICTFAIYKYDRSGKYLAKAEYYPNDLDWSTRLAFRAGNCAMAFQGDLLICSYAREMYNGHQSNAVFCVETDTMTENPLYDSYSSHSFNQSVLVLDEDTVVFADHGDAYPRGFAVNVVSAGSRMNGHNNKGVLPFRFYGETGDNYTNAFLTGIYSVNTGIALIAASAKEYSAKYEGAPRQLFMQVIDAYSGESVLAGDTRGNGGSGIVWLTDYTDGSTVSNAAAAALDDSRLLVMWERWRDNEFVNSYYSIVKSNGVVETDSVPMQKARINGTEELKTDGVRAYWTYADGETATTYTLLPDSPSADSIKDAKVTLAFEQKVYTGKAIKPAVTVEYDGVKLKKGTDYTVTYKNNKKVGTASVTITGKGNYSGKQTVKFTITPKAVSGFTVTRGTSRNALKWNAVTGATGYEIEIDKYTSSDGYWFSYDKTVTKTSKKAAYNHKISANRYVAFSYRVRPFVKVNGVKIYGEWTDYVSPYFG